MAVNAIAGAVIGLLVYMSDDQQPRDLTSWSMGGLGGADLRAAGFAFVCILAAAVGLMRLARPLDLLQLGERAAWHAGLEVEQVERAAGLWSALAVAPHIARLGVGDGHRFLSPASAVVGAALLLAADLMVRKIVPPAEPSVGLAASLIGGPFSCGCSCREGEPVLEAVGVHLAWDGKAVLSGVTLFAAPG